MGSLMEYMNFDFKGEVNSSPKNLSPLKVFYSPAKPGVGNGGHSCGASRKRQS